MWGDPERATQLDSSDPLSALLLQVTSPGHIPWNDPRWQELLHGYDVWVHVSESTAHRNPVFASACRNMSKHAATSSNLAALAMHVSRMLRQLHAAPSDGLMALSHRIAVVGKARATAGALQLFRVLLHHVMVHNLVHLEECLYYKSRDTFVRDANAGMELVHAIMHCIAACCEDGVPSSNSSSLLANAIPEVYDTIVLAMQLLLVMLSTQLYRPFKSSIAPKTTQDDDNHHHRSQSENIFLRVLVTTPEDDTASSEQQHWKHRDVIRILLEWWVFRPKAPERSITSYYAQLAQSVVAAKGERVGPDGMYESYWIVKAVAKRDSQQQQQNSSHHDKQQQQDATTTATSSSLVPSSKLILDATKGVLILSSTIILLPFRLVSLALGLWGYGSSSSSSSSHSFESHVKQQWQSRSATTKDVLWLSESPVADLAASVLLLLTNNHRSNNNNNIFRNRLQYLTDNRWDVELMTTTSATTTTTTLPDLPLHHHGDDHEDETKGLLDNNNTTTTPQSNTSSLAVNFELLFEAFGATVHNELGALWLYTMWHACPAFAESLVVRSDLDTLVMPLLRTLYFASASVPYDTRKKSESRDSWMSTSATSNEQKSISIRSCPFRSLSQLYVIMILLLMFSQDPSFGSDAFRRVMISHVAWYKERILKDMNLGSVVVVVLLRCLTFYLHRLQDSFLLSNCCAVLMNLSPSIVELHEYTAMRLVSVTVSCLKKCSQFKENDDDAELYMEVCRTLLQVLKHCVSTRNVERNVHLVYALVYHQTEWNKYLTANTKQEKKALQQQYGDLGRLPFVVETASQILQEHASRTAAKALKVLDANMELLLSRKKQRNEQDFAFTYEEEADPEVFFVPYVWEVVVCTVTAGWMEWNKSEIQVFALLEEEEEEENAMLMVEDDAVGNTDNNNGDGPLLYSKDVKDLV